MCLLYPKIALCGKLTANNPVALANFRGLFRVLLVDILVKEQRFFGPDQKMFLDQLTLDHLYLSIPDCA